MSVPYNPLELLNLPLLKDLLRKNTNFLVVQRLQWPGIAEKKGFIATPYQQQKPAIEHAQTLDLSEGRVIDLQFELNKILELIESPKYLLFLNTCRDRDWQEKVLKHYQKNIFSNLKIIALYDFNIELSFKFGKLTATIQNEGSTKEINLSDLIK